MLSSASNVGPEAMVVEIFGRQWCKKSSGGCCSMVGVCMWSTSLLVPHSTSLVPWKLYFVLGEQGSTGEASASCATVPRESVHGKFAGIKPKSFFSSC